MHNIISHFKGNSLLHDIGFTTIGQIIVMVLALTFNKIISHYLSPDEYAVFSIGLKGANVLAFIMLFSLGIALPVKIAALRGKKEQRDEGNLFYAAVIILITTTIITGSITLLFKDTVAMLIYNDHAYSNLIFPGILLAAGTAISTFLYSYYRGIGKFHTFNVIQVILQLVLLPIILVSQSNIDLQFMLRGYVLCLIPLVVICYIMFTSYKLIGITKKDIRKYIVSVTTYCAPRVPGELFLFALTVVPLIIVNARFGSTSAASFATSLMLLSLITPLFQFIGMAFLPYASKRIAQGNLASIKISVSKLRLLYLAISIPSVVVIICFTELIIHILFNQNYIQFAPEARIIILGVIPYSLYLLLRNPLDAITHKPFNTINLAISFCVLVLLLLTLPNTLAASVAIPVSYSILGLLSEIAWHHNIKLKQVSY